MNVLLTGGSGFIGSSLAILLKKTYPTYNIITLDNLKRRGSELNLPRLKQAGILFFHGDIRNKEDFNELPVIDALIECSAEPSVLAGINSPPDYLIGTNFNGTINCLNFAVKNKAAFIFLSTSRIYPIEAIDKIILREDATRFSIAENQSLAGISPKGIAEDFPIDGYRSLYGASKLASELFIQEYQHYYGLKTVINRCGVVAGPWQMGKIDQGVVVLWMAKHFWKQSLSYIGFGGTGKQVRDMLHVADLFDLVDKQLHQIDKVNGQIFNVGGSNESSASLLEMTEICQKITGNIIPITSVAETRQADIRSYITDNSKITATLGWKPTKTAYDIFADIYEWIKENEDQLAPLLK
jgi:CDP-paratose 2-epimerase